MPHHMTVLVRTERKARGLAPTGKVIEQALKIRGVTDAFPTVGRFDGAVFVEGRSFEDAGSIALKVQDIPGIRSTETLVELP